MVCAKGTRTRIGESATCDVIESFCNIFSSFSCARQAHDQAELQLSKERDLNDYERAKRMAELDLIKKEAEIELMRRKREEEKASAMQQITLEREKQVTQIQTFSAKKTAEYEAAKQEDDILRSKLQRRYEQENQELKVRREQQALKLEQDERELDLEVRKEQESLELELTKAKEDQSRKHADEDHQLDQDMKKEQQKFEQQMQQFTTMKTLAIEEEFSKKMVLDVEVAGANPEKKFRLRASNQCSKDLLSIVVGAMQRPAVEAAPSPSQNIDVDEKMSKQTEDMSTQPNPLTGANDQVN